MFSIRRRQASLLFALMAVAALAALFTRIPTGQAAFPGPAGKIYYDADKDVWSVNPDGSGAKRLTADYAGYDTEAAASADGTRVAFISERDGIGAHLWIMSADGSGKKQVTSATNDPQTQAGDTGPAWSPDGTRIAYSSDSRSPSRPRIFVVAIASGAVTALTAPDASQFDDEPAWSPDGSKIAFHRHDQSAGEQVWVIAAGGGGATEIAAGDEPNWAPDGSKIVYRSPAGGGALFIVSAAGGTQTPVSTATAGGANDPSFSPDGTQIVYSNDSTPFTLYRVPAAGGSSTKVIEAEAGNTSGEFPRPDWARVAPSLRLTATCKAHKLTVTLVNGSAVRTAAFLIRLKRGAAVPFVVKKLDKASPKLAVLAVSFARTKPGAVLTASLTFTSGQHVVLHATVPRCR